MERSAPGARRPLAATAPAATTTAGGEVGVLVGGNRLRLFAVAALAVLTVLIPLTGLTASASQTSSGAIRAGSSDGGTLIGSGSSAIESEPTQAQLEAQHRMAVLDG